jgi:putative PIN family toxin of toxin-antitoxin system
MRAVLDTNLLVSYFLTQGDTMSRIINHWEQGHFVNIVSPAILTELKEVVNRPRLRPYMSADPQALIDVIEQDAEFIPGDLKLTGICRDPKDDIFIACAVEGHADVLVSGDDDLLTVGAYQGVQIINPAAFLQLLEEQTGQNAI